MWHNWTAMTVLLGDKSFTIFVFCRHIDEMRPNPTFWCVNQLPTIKWVTRLFIFDNFNFLTLVLHFDRLGQKSSWRDDGGKQCGNSIFRTNSWKVNECPKQNVFVGYPSDILPIRRIHPLGYIKIIILSDFYPPNFFRILSGIILSCPIG